MALNIKNPEVVGLVRRLAHERGVDMTEAIRLAVEHELLTGGDEQGRRISLLRKLSAQVTSLPVLDPRSPDEIARELYEEGAAPP